MTAPSARADGAPRHHSLRRRLLLGILLPVTLFIAFNTFSLYHQTLASLHTAYDRTLLASAKSISEQLDVTGFDDEAQLRATVPYSALEAFEADNQSQMFYRVSNLKGELVSGFEELPVWHGTIPLRPPYAALVDFYDDELGDRDVRVAVLLQPVASANGRAMAVIQVAETLEVRETLALQILWKTLLRQALLIVVIAITVVVVVHLATRPVSRISKQLQSRHEGDLSLITAPLPRVSCSRCWMPPTRSCNACATCCATKSGLCAMPHTSCAHRWPCSRRRCSQRCGATWRHSRLCRKSAIP